MVNLLTPPGLVVHHVLQVHYAETQVSRFVLPAHAEDPLLGVVLADIFAHAEQRLHEALSRDVHYRRHLSEVLRLDDHSQALLRKRAEQPPAVGERPLRKSSELPAPSMV